MNATRAVVLGILLALTPAAQPAAQDKKPQPAGKEIEGGWLGTLDVGGAKLRLYFKVERKDDKLTGTMDSIDQGAKGIPLSKAEFRDGEAVLEIKSIQGAFTGKLKDEGKTLDGHWEQSGQKFPLVLKRTDKLPEVKRPQEPKKPYPYLEEEVTFENKKAGVKFAGTLTLPKGAGPFAAAVLITGSGPQDRDESLLGHKPFLVLADHLTRQGIAVLRVDDRGVGGSTGDTMQSTTADFAGDALAAAAFLKTRQEIDAKRIGFIGHSEGGVVGPLAASQDAGIAFVVMLAGTGLPGEEILYLQGQAILKAEGLSGKPLEDQRAMQEWMFGVVKKEKDEKTALKKLEEAWAAKLAKMSDEERAEAVKAEATLKAQFKSLVTPWFRAFLTHDPRPALRKVVCPVLALLGEKDVQVPPKENAAAISAALKEGGNKDFTVRELPGLNHLFQTCKTGGLSEYAQIEETLAPAALEAVSAWILERVKAK